MNGVKKDRTDAGHALGVVSIAVDNTGTYAASSSLDSFIRVWNLQEASTKAVMETPPSETWAIQFHPTADQLTVVAAAGSSGGVAVWDCDSAAKKQELKGPGVSLVSSDQDLYAKHTVDLQACLLGHISGFILLCAS